MIILRDLVGNISNGQIKYVAIGTFDTAVVSNKCGIASTMRDTCVTGGHKRIKNLGSFEDMSTGELSEYIFSDVLLEASIGMAAINSSSPDIHENNLSEVNAADLIMKHGEGKTVAVIGHFPFIKKLARSVKKLYVFGQPPLKGELPSEKEPELLPDADVVAISGTTLINHTFENVMSYIRKDAYKIMLGPSTPLSKVLFDYGIDAISGTIVENTDLLLKYLRQGATFRFLEGKRLVTMEKEDF